MGLHIFLFHLAQILFELRSFYALIPLFAVKFDLLKGLWHFVVIEALEHGVRVEDIGFEKVEFGS